MSALNSSSCPAAPVSPIGQGQRRVVDVVEPLDAPDAVLGKGVALGTDRHDAAGLLGDAQLLQHVDVVPAGVGVV